MIERLAGFPGNVAAFRCNGRVTKEDYDGVLLPAVGNTLRTHDKVRLYYEIGTDFAGLDTGAMWEDFKNRRRTSHALGTCRRRQRCWVNQAGCSLFRFPHAGRYQALFAA
jgi:hypothetical protein